MIKLVANGKWNEKFSLFICISPGSLPKNEMPSK